MSSPVSPTAADVDDEWEPGTDPVAAELVQRKVFTRWINWTLKRCTKSVVAVPPVVDLYNDLSDGRTLTAVVDVLTAGQSSQDLLPVLSGSNEAEIVTSIDALLKYLRQHDVDSLGGNADPTAISNIDNVTASDFINKNPRAVRTVVWHIIQRWQIERLLRTALNHSAFTNAENAENAFILWCRQIVDGYQRCNITNLTTSWLDGFAFNAIIHRYHSDWFVFDSLNGYAPHQVLEHAFETANTQLNVDRLLDSEDLVAERLDKKSVMTYVSSCLMALHNFEVTSSPSVTSPDLSDAYLQQSSMASAGSQSSLFSTGSTAVDAASFNDSLDKVLTWLRDAIDAVSKQSPVASDIDTLKGQFHRHEDFMVRLTHKQSTIGNVLHDGNCLLQQQQTLLSDVERRSVDSQLTLLSNGWEELRVKAMDRQARLQHTLMDLQQQQLDRLSEWLDRMDVRIKNFQPVGGNEQELFSLIENLKPLQAEVKQQQDKVTSLHSMVVVVDESNAESAYAAMEKQLEVLNVRWTAVQQFIDERSVQLNAAYNQWRAFDERLNNFAAWLTETENTLVEIDRRRHSSQDLVTADINDVVEQVQCLKAIESEMDIMIKYFDDLNDLAAELARSAGTDQSTVLAIDSQLRDCQERWDNVVQQMELSSKQIAHYGVELIVSTTPTGTQTVTVSRAGGAEAVSFDLSAPSAALASYPQDSGVTRLQQQQQQSAAVVQKRLEFDRQIAELSQWLDQTESTLELLSMSDVSTGQDNLSVEEQQVLIEDAETGINAHEKQMTALRQTANALRNQLIAANDKPDVVNDALQRVESRWLAISQQVQAGREKILASSAVSQFYVELNAVQNIIAIYDTWATNEGLNIADDFMLLSRQLEQCRVKQKSLMLHDSRVSKLNEQAIELLKRGRIPASVDEKLKQLNDRWMSTIKRLNERHSVLMKALQSTPPKSFTDAFIELSEWLDRREQTFNTSPFLVNDVTFIDQQIALLKDLRTELRDRSASLEYINHAGNDLVIKTSSGAEAPAVAGGKPSSSSQKLNSDLHQLNGRWNQLQTAIDERINKYTITRDQLKHLRSQMEGVTNWLDEVEVFLTAEEAAVGDLETLQAQLAESRGVQDDIRTMQPTVEGIASVSKMLRSHSEVSFAARLGGDVDKILNRWTSVIEMSRLHTVKLSSAESDTKQIFADISSADAWLEDVTAAHINKLCSIQTEVELGQYISNYQRLESEVKTIREPELLRIRSSVQSVVSSAGQGGAVELVAAMSRLESKFADVQKRITATSSKFQTASSQLVAFRGLINEETEWFKSLEEKLSHGVISTSADAEELSEELDDLESFLSLHSDDLKISIASVAQSLINEHIMTSTVTANLDAYNTRLQKMLDEAKHRIEQLEEAIVQSQAREAQIVDMSQWMTYVNELLQTRLEADVLASDSPQEFATLKLEFDQHDASIADLEKDVISFREQGKHEAANRLENQLAILKKHYAEVVAKFVKFQRPADFDVKMASMRRLLEDIEERLTCLEITSIEPDDIQNQLDQCMKFYKAMSEAKCEVEYVIKTGRQVVEKKQVDNPDVLNTQLDAIKMLYNELGAQVTQGKTSLEQALKLAKKLKKESTSLRDFISTTSKELTRRESSSTSHRETEDELTWFKTTIGELNKKQPVLSALSDVTSQLAKMADEAVMAAADENVRQLGNQLNDLLDRMTSKKVILQDQVEHFERIYVEFETMQRELVIWVDNAEDVLTELDRLQAEQEPADEDVTKFKTLQGEHDQLVAQLDTVRDTAVDIIANSARYSKTVEPLLTILNQRWQQVSLRIKERQTFFRNSSLRNKQHVSISGGRMSISPTPNDDVINFDSLLSKLTSGLNQFQNNLRDVDENANSEKLASILTQLDLAEEDIEKQIAGIDIHLGTSSTSAGVDNIKEQVEQLKVRWRLLHEESVAVRLSMARVVYPEFDGFLRRSDQLLYWLSDADENRSEVVTSSGGDDNAFTELLQEFNGKQLELQRLSTEASQLPSSVIVQVTAVETLENLNVRMQKFRSHLEQLSPSVAELITVTVVSKNQSEPSLPPTPAAAKRSDTRLDLKPIIFASGVDRKQFDNSLQELSEQIQNVETELMMPLYFQDFTCDLSCQPEEEQLILSKAVSTLQQSLESARAFYDDDEALNAKLTEEERLEMTKKLDGLQVQVTGLKRRADSVRESTNRISIVSVEDFKLSTADVTSWLKEAEGTVATAVDYNNTQQVEQYIDRIKELETELQPRRQTLQALIQNGRRLYYSNETSVSDKNIISGQLAAVINKWNNVAKNLSIKRKVVEDRLTDMRKFTSLLDKFAKFLTFSTSTVETLENRKPFNNDKRDLSDHDFKVVSDILKTGNAEMEALNELYRTQQTDITAADTVRQTVDNIRVDWIALRDRAVKLQSSRCHETDIDSCQQDVEMVNPITVQMQNAEAEIQSTTAVDVPTLWPEVESQYSDFLARVKLNVETQNRVIIGDIDNIEQTIKTIKVKLVDIEENGKLLMATCDDKLREETNRDLLSDRVARMYGWLDKVKLSLSHRNVELDDLLLECRQFAQVVHEFERWLNAIEEDCETQSSQSKELCTVNAIEASIKANNKLQKEALPWQQKVEEMRTIVQRLVDSNPNDNSGPIMTTMNRVENRWANLMMRLTSQERRLQGLLSSVSSFESDMKELMLWLTKAEVVLMHHDEMTVANSSCTESEQQWHKLEQSFIDLHMDINSHKKVVKALNTTGEIMANASDKSQNELNDRLKEMNERWNRVIQRSAELRARLDVQTNPTQEMLQLLIDNADWLKQLNNEISEKFQLVADLSHLSSQQEQSVLIKNKLETRRLDIESAVRGARLTRVREQILPDDYDIDNSEEKRAGDVNEMQDMAAIEQLVVDIHKQADVLFKSWTSTNGRINDWQQQIANIKQNYSSNPWEELTYRRRLKMEPIMHKEPQKLQLLDIRLSESVNFVGALEKEVTAWRPNTSIKLGLSQLQLEYGQTKSFQRDLRSLEGRVAAIKSELRELETDVVKLSPKIIQTTDRTEHRVAALFRLSSDRLSKLISALREFGPSSQNVLLQSVSFPWERALTEPSKVPYYINHSTEQTQWDHPEMTSIQQAVADVNSVKFSAYRTSMKLRILQKRLKVDMLDLMRVVKEFNQLGLMSSYGNNRQLTMGELVSYLVSLLTGVVDSTDVVTSASSSSPVTPPTVSTSRDGQQQPADTVATSTDLVLNWLLNVYDRSRTGGVSLLAFTTAIILMCKGHLEDKCKALFQLVADTHGLVDDSRLHALLNECIQIPRYLGEVAAFGGSNVEPSVKSCFEKAGGREEIDMAHFVDWMKMEPQSMVWLPVLHRLTASETVRHPVKCNACKETPIVGLRYRCLKCFRLDMCQQCFFAGHKAKSHKLTHPMQEYCTATTSGEDMRDLTKVLKNKLRTKRYFKKHPRLGYLPVQPDLDGGATNSGTLQRRIAVASMEQEIQPTLAATTATSASGSTTPSDSESRHIVSSQKITPTISRHISSSSQEMHLRLELYANRLAEVERKRRETTPDWEDEHSLIAQYCQRLHGTPSSNSLQSPMQIMLAVDADQKVELEAMIRELEDENRALQSEYDQLKQAHKEHIERSSFNSDVMDDLINDAATGATGSGVGQNGSVDKEMIAEAKLLRQHKGRLEARMKVLEEHNEQLDSQLKRLRQLLNSNVDVEEMGSGGVSGGGSGDNARILTYPSQCSTSVADLSSASSHSSLPRRGPPPSFASTGVRPNTDFADQQQRPPDVTGQRSDDEVQSHPRPAVRGSSHQMTDLLQVAGEVGKAVESLVNIMTDDEGQDDQDLDLDRRDSKKRATPQS